VPFTSVVPQDSRRTATMTLLWASVVGMLACPQLFTDDFESSSLGRGGDACAGVRSCAGSSGLASSGAGAGVNAGAGGSASVGGGAAGAGSTAGSHGTPDASAGSTTEPDAGAPADAGGEPVAEPDCRVVYLTDSTHRAVDNCVGIGGWNEVVTDPSTASTMSLSYRNGNVCFLGRVVPAGWGAVYNLTLANEDAWNATDFEVDGFELDATGPSLPPEIEVIFTDDEADFCSFVTPTASTLIPFESAREECATNPGVDTLDATALFFLRLHLPIATMAYDVEFCLRIRALP
jgi:hypothetical protein